MKVGIEKWFGSVIALCLLATTGCPNPERPPVVPEIPQSQPTPSKQPEKTPDPVLGPDVQPK